MMAHREIMQLRVWSVYNKNDNNNNNNNINNNDIKRLKNNDNMSGIQGYYAVKGLDIFIIFSLSIGVPTRNLAVRKFSFTPGHLYDRIIDEQLNFCRLSIERFKRRYFIFILKINLGHKQNYLHKLLNAYIGCSTLSAM